MGKDEKQKKDIVKTKLQQYGDKSFVDDTKIVSSDNKSATSDLLIF